MYNQAQFEETFKSTELYTRLKEDFDVLIFDKHFPIATIHLNQLTVREIWGSPSAAPTNSKFEETVTRNTFQTYCTMVPFYYIDFLMQQQPNEIYDLGCGWNLFKRYFPVIGIGAENTDNEVKHWDLHDFVDDVFIAGHQNYYDSVFSICALHFHPLSTIRKVVCDFYSMIAPGGRGWLSLNSQRMVDYDKKFQNSTPSEVQEYVNTQLKDLPGKILAQDVDVIGCSDNHMDGNIQIVFEKG
jgi:hypothetical protein